MASILNSFGDKSIIVIKDHTQIGGYAEGGVYVGGTAQYTNYNIGTTLPFTSPPNASTELYSLCVLGSMNITGGINTQTSALSPSGTLTKYTMSSAAGMLGQPLRTVEWLQPTTNLVNRLECIAFSLGDIDANGTATLAETILELTGSNSSLNTFTIDGDNILGADVPIANITQISLYIPEGSTVIINVIGKNIKLNATTTQINGELSAAEQAQKIIWNMPDVTTLTLNSVIYGTILAPVATTTAIEASQLYGTLFTGSLVGTLISKKAIFDGNLPMFVDSSLSTGCTGITNTTISATTDVTNSVSIPYAARAVNDIIGSIALEQTAIAHIMNAEGEKIQKIIQLGASLEQMLKINASVTNMINSIACLETILQAKLAIAKRGGC